MFSILKVVQINYFEDNMRFVVSACTDSALPMFLTQVDDFENNYIQSLHAMKILSKKKKKKLIFTASQLTCSHIYDIGV